MKISAIVIVVIVIVIIAVVGLLAYETLPTSTTSNNSTWHRGANYPLQLTLAFGVAGQQCVNDTGYVYCIGGEDVNNAPRSEIHSSSPLSASSPNITSWSQNSVAYPLNIHAQSCVAYSGYAYCVGGIYDESEDDTASTYFTILDGSGTLGHWNATTAYPVPIDSQYCVASSGYIYCVGGNNEIDGTNADSAASNSIYYAQLSSSGIGNWSHSTSYPSNHFFPSCFASAGYIYCIGGTDSNGNAQSSVYFASLTPSGVGPWTQTTSYPMNLVGQSCSFSSGNMYCVGGQQNNMNAYANAVYYAQASSSGIGSWKKGANYPEAVETICVLSSNYVYCIGGFDSSNAGETDSTYYASLSSFS